jgi:hypothetical protein
MFAFPPLGNGLLMERATRITTFLLVVALVLGGFLGSSGHDSPGPDRAVGSHFEALRREPPAWYTQDLHRRVAAAGPRGVRIPGEPVPASALAIQGIRPGSWMVFPAWCTMNFVFRSRGRLFIGTAGHCTDRVGQSVTLFMAPGRVVRVGRVVQRVNRGQGKDFALVRIRPALRRRVSPKMALVGGPTGAFRGRGRRTVFHVGHGVVVGTGGTPRAGISLKWGRARYMWAGVGAPGDSGSPVRVAGGKAAGNLTHIAAGGPQVAPRLVGTRIGKILRMLGPRFRLVRAARDLPP